MMMLVIVVSSGSNKIYKIFPDLEKTEIFIDTGKLVSNKRRLLSLKMCKVCSKVSSLRKKIENLAFLVKKPKMNLLYPKRIILLFLSNLT